jgi:chromate transporter
LRPEAFGGSSHEKGNARQSLGAALIDDDTPTPPHAQFSWRGFWRVSLVCLTLWGSAMGVLATAFGLESALVQMGWFFTKAALMTFGGAYAVLPYVYQGAVENFHWLTATQMIDGLALGRPLRARSSWWCPLWPLWAAGQKRSSVWIRCCSLESSQQ